MVSIPFSGPRRLRLLHRLHAFVAVRARAAGGFRYAPEPRTVGEAARGRQLLAGNLLFGGHLVEAPGLTPWDIDPPGPGFAAEAQGFTWLDDLYAVGDDRARETARRWTMDWIARFGAGQGPGWTPQLTARRVIRQINHALFLLRGQGRDVSEPFYRALGRQTTFLARSWRATPPGLPRIEALTGTIHAGLSLLGMDDHVGPAIEALCREAETVITDRGGVPSRNPEELLEILTLLNWAVLAIRAAERPVPEVLLTAIAAIVPNLRALRHADGGLARFHGGGRGGFGRVDQALADAAVRAQPRRHGLHMGYARLVAGRTTLILDAGRPPSGACAVTAHASTLAFELTSGRRPLIVNAGSGRSFGPDWRRAGRITGSHSTLGLDLWSSSRFLPGRSETDPEPLAEGPVKVDYEITSHDGIARIEASHDGYRRRFGLLHGRTLDLTHTGRELSGVDFLAALSGGDKALFDTAMDEHALQGLPFVVRFHLHPEAQAELDLGGRAVSIALKSGEVWVLRHDSACDLAVAPSVYLETGRLRPRATQQVVLSGRAMSYATQVRWSLAKVQDTPNATRDLAAVNAE